MNHRAICRRHVLEGAALAAAGAAMAACGATPQVVEKVVTQVVEKEVTKVVEGTPQVVKETVIVEVQSTKASEEPITLTLAQWWLWENTPDWLEMNGIFQGEHNVRFNLSSIPWSEFVTKMLTLAAADALPDIFGVNGSHTPVYGYRDILLDLTPFLERDGFPIDRFFQTTVKIYQYPPGKQLCLPDQLIPTNVTFYNESLFEEAGVEPPGEDWTFDDAVTMAKALTKESGGRIEQYGMQHTWGPLPNPLFGAFGGYMANDLYYPTMATFDSSGIEECANWAVDTVFTHEVHPTADAQKEMGGSSEMFMTGRLGFTLGWQLDACQNFFKAPSLKWNMTISPHKPDLKPNYPECGVGYGAPAKSKNPELAWQYFSWISSPESWERRAEIQARRSDYIYYPSPVVSVAEKFIEARKEDFPHYPAIMAAVREGWSYPWWILHPGWEEFWATALNPIGERIMRREITVSDGLQQLQEAAQKMIDNPPAK